MITLLALMTWVYPVVLAAGSFLIARRLTWRVHPGLCLFLLVESYLAVLTAAHWMTRDVSILAQLLAYAAVTRELAVLSRVNLTARAQAVVAALAMILPAVRAGMQPWTLDRQLSLFRSDFRIAAALIAVSIAAYRLKHPALERHAECRRHRVYLLGMTAWLTIGAITGSFVKGGLGMALVGYTPNRWLVIGVTSYAALIVTVIGLSVALTLGTPGRKHAAKRPDGRTATGLIEMTRAA